VYIQHAEYRFGSQLVVRGVTLYEVGQGPGRAALVSAEHVTIDIQDVWQWVRTGSGHIERVAVRGARLRLERFADGSWNVQRLLKASKNTLPGSVLLVGKNLEVHYCDASRPSVAPQVWYDVQLMVQHHRAAGDRVRTLIRASGKSAETGPLEARMEWSGTDGIVQVSANQVHLTPQFWTLLPEPWRSRCAALIPLRGEASITARLHGQHPHWHYEIEGVLSDGWYSDPGVPYALTAISAQFQINDQGCQVQRVMARAGLAEFQGSFQRRGWQEGAPYELELAARRLPLDTRLPRLLTSTFQSLWNKYSPSGLADVDFEVHWDGQQLQRRATAHLKELAFTYDKFPYRVNRATGTLTWQEDRLTVKLAAPIGGRTATIDGQWQFASGQPVGWLEIQTDGPVPLDEALLAALPEKTQAFLRSLNPTGLLEASVHVERQLDQSAFQRRMEIHIHNGTLQYDRFPYPLQRVCGTVYVEGDRVWFTRLTGRNDSGFVVAQGEWNPQSHPALQLRLQCMDIALQESLKLALPRAVQEIWNELQPQGTIDRLDVSVAYVPQTRRLDVEVSGEKWDPERNVEGRAVSLRPTRWPLRWDNVTGSFTYRDGVVRFQDISAEHGSARVRELTGLWAIDPVGGWQFRIDKLDWERLNVDESFVATLPGGLRDLLSSLHLRGMAHGSGQVLWQGHRGTGTHRLNWRALVDLEDGQVAVGSPIEHIRGGGEFWGELEGNRVTLDGQLRVDAAVFRGMPLSRLRGPVRWDGKRLYLGNREAREGEPVVQPLSARLFGGDLQLQLAVEPSEPPQFHLIASLADADLAELAAHVGVRGEPISGRLFGELTLSGSCGLVETWRGGGQIQVTRANLYQLPLMVAMLKLLNVRPPDATAFTNGDMQFRWEGDRLFLSRVALQGDAISLVGKGTVSLERQLDVTFYALVGREEAQWPIFRPLMQQAARNMLLIDVKGPLDEPTVTPRPFPELNAALQQWLAELPAELPAPHAPGAVLRR